MSESVLSPTPFQLSRRGFLGTLTALSLGTVAGCELPASAADEDLVGGGLGRGPASAPQVGAGDGDYTPLTPFAMTGVSELSQDYFLFQTHQIDPAKDTFVAYSRADGEVEAMLLQDGRIKQIYRDPTQPGGWNIYTFQDASAVDVVDMVAGVSAPKKPNAPAGSPRLTVCYRRKGDDDNLYVAQRSDSDSERFTFTTVNWKAGAKAGPLQISVNYDNSLLVSAITESSSRNTADGYLHLWSDCPNGAQGGPVYGSLFGFAYNTGSVPALLSPGWAATIAKPWATQANYPEVELLLPGGTYGPVKVGTISVTPPSVHLWRWAIGTNRPGVSGNTVLPVMTSMLYSSGAGNPPLAPTKTTTAYRVEDLNALGSFNQATAVVSTIDSSGGGLGVRKLWTLSPGTSPGGASTVWAWNELQLPADVPVATDAVTVSTSIRPLPDGENPKPSHEQTAARQFLDVFALTGGTLNVLRQAPRGNANDDYDNPLHCPAIPLQPDIAHMDSQAGLSSGNELLLVATDGALQSLTKDPDTGVWSDHPIQLPAGDLEETSSYRLTLTVADAWNMPLVGQTLHLSTPTTTVALWNGATVTLGPDPVAVTTDGYGEVTLALLAGGLSAPTLTVTGAGLPTASINPSDPINTYLQGGAPLNYLPPLTGDSLADAKTPDGQPLAPGASDPAAAKDAVANMNRAANQASSPNALNARRSTIHRRRDGQLTGTGKAELKGIFSDIDNWAHDALHAIKKGAAKIKEITYDAATKVFTLAADFANWAGNAVNVIVKGIEDAAHVVHAFLNKLGAEIVHAIKWLAAEVIGTFKDAVALAHQFNDWIAKTCHFVADQANADATRVDAWLAAKQASIKADLTAVADRYHSTTLSQLSTNPPQSVGDRAGQPRRARGTRRVGDSDDDDQQSPHSDWFWKKVKNELFGSLVLPPVSNLPDLMKNLLTAAGTALDDFAAAFADFAKFLIHSIAHPKDADGLGVGLLLQAVSKLVDAVFVLARAIITVMLDLLALMANAIPGILTTPLGQAGGIIGALFKLVGLGNIQIGTVAATLYAFPIVLGYKITHKGQGRPFDTTPHSARNRGYGDAKDDLKTSASVALGTWALFDTIAASEKTAGRTLPFTTVVDIMSPILVGALTVPAIKDGEPYLSPPVSGDTADTLDFISWLMGMAPAALEAAGEYLEHAGQKDPDLPNQLRMITFAVSASGVLALGTGIQALEAGDNPSAWDYSDVILNSIPDIIGFCLDESLLKATEMGSGVVAGVLTLTSGIMGAAAHSNAA